MDRVRACQCATTRKGDSTFLKHLGNPTAARAGQRLQLFTLAGPLAQEDSIGFDAVLEIYAACSDYFHPHLAD